MSEQNYQGCAEVAFLVLIIVLMVAGITSLHDKLDDVKKKLDTIQQRMEETPVRKTFSPPLKSLESFGE